MTGVPEVRSARTWQPLGTGSPPTVDETGSVLLRGLPPSCPVTVGFTHCIADDRGNVDLRLADDELLRGHIGLVEVRVSDVVAGEIRITPSKMSEAAYDVLRADLHRTWTNLVFATDSPASVSAGPPPARELLRRIDRPLMQILEQPQMRLEVDVQLRRLERVRHRRELSPAVLRAGRRSRPALTRTLGRTTDTAENQLCAVTLQLLRNHARRDPSAGDIVATVDRLLRHPSLPTSRQPIRRITWGMRSDSRYRQVLAVHQLLQRPELEATEGPGDLRLGVPALPRLYEYWVFLQVLTAAHARFGPPTGPGFEQLAIPVSGNRRRLELRPGTTVTFPGPVHIAFEPAITARGDGWMGIEYVAHPDRARQQFLATPDVTVLDQRPDRKPGVLHVLDAKYVGRPFVELDAARTHEKYSRMRLGGVPVVDNVVVVHPHRDYANQWAGYGHLPMQPGIPVDDTAWNWL